MKSFKRALLFTGHMIDFPERPTPRFPPGMEQVAAKAIRQSVADVAHTVQGPVLGVASGARGGDILFLEACRAAGLTVHIVLPFDVETFLDASVRGAEGGDWERRFRKLWDSAPADRRETLSCPEGQNPYDWCNRRMLAVGREAAERLHLLALWNGEDAEDHKPGGTASFLQMVRDAGEQFTWIDARSMLKEL